MICMLRITGCGLRGRPIRSVSLACTTTAAATTPTPTLSGSGAWASQLNLIIYQSGRLCAAGYYERSKNVSTEKPEKRIPNGFSVLCQTAQDPNITEI